MTDRQPSTDVSRRRFLAASAGTIASAGLLSTGASAESTTYLSADVYASQSFYEEHGWQYLDELEQYTNTFEDVWPGGQISRVYPDGNFSWDVGYGYKNPSADGSNVIDRVEEFNDWLAQDGALYSTDVAIVLDWNESDSNTGAAQMPGTGGGAGSDRRTLTVNVPACFDLPSHWSPEPVAKVMAHEYGHMYSGAHRFARVRSNCEGTLLAKRREVDVPDHCNGIQQIINEFTTRNANRIASYAQNEV